MKENSPRDEKTQLDISPSESDGEKTQLHDESSPSSHSSTDHQPFKWDSAVSNPNLRPKDYYDSSLTAKWLNTHTRTMASLGLVTGFLFGYWLHSFRYNLQLPVTPTPQVVESLSPQPAPTPTSMPTEVAPEPAPVVTAKTEAELPKKSVAPAPVAKKKWISAIRIGTDNRKVHVDIDVGGNSFKYTAKMLNGPPRLTLELLGLTGNHGKSLIKAGKQSSPVREIKTTNKKDRVVVLIELQGKTQPAYSVQRSKKGVRVTFSQAKK